MSELSALLDKHLNNLPEPEPTPESPPPEPKKWTCKICKRDDFPRVQDLATHVRTFHKGQNPPPIIKRQASGRRSQAGPAVKGPGFLTAKMMLSLHGPKIKICEHDGIRKAFIKHPDWEQILLGRGEPKQNLYDAIHELRHGNRYEQELRRAGKTRDPVTKARLQHKKLPQGRHIGAKDTGPRYHWTEQQYELARSIMAMPQYRTPSGFTKWDNVFHDHPDWAQQLNFSNDKRNQFMSFVGRVRAGKAPYKTLEFYQAKREQPVAVNGTAETIEINGQKWTKDEIAKALELARQHLTASPIKYCPNCGHNLQMQQKAFSIARKHTEEPNA